jgi:ribosomal protein S18 acetylase RimI-like enzyme
MSEFTIRDATLEDIPFLVETIIEAEKSGTGRLSYSTVFGLTPDLTAKYLSEMLEEEVDGCELSISSFTIAEKNETIAAAIAGWIEGIEGVPSNVLKGNLLNYTLPRDCIKKAADLNHIINDLHIDYISNTMQLGLVYVSSDFRGKNLVKIMLDHLIDKLSKVDPDISTMYVQVFANNIPAIKAYEKAGFEIELIKTATNKEVLNYLPDDKKILMKKVIT